MGQSQSVNQKPSTTARVTKQLSATPKKPTNVASPTLSTNQITYNQIQFGRSLGSGAFCKVSLGKINSVSYAIKEPLVANKSTIEGFTKEAELLMKLRHPNIVGCFATTLNPYSMVLSLAETSLANYLHSHRIPDWTERFQFIYDIASALVYLEASNLLHGDIKPANVLLYRASSGPLIAKLADFGFATPIDRSIGYVRNVTYGTTGFLAPEIVRELRANPKSDIFALAMLAWCLTTNEEGPFNASSSQISQYIILGARPSLPRCPTILSQFITWGWEQKPEDRPTAAQVVEMFQPHVARR